MSRLGALAAIRGGSGFPEIYQGLESGDYPFVKVSDMSLDGNRHYLVNANNYVDQTLVDRLRLTVFPEDTVVFAKVGAAIYLNKRRQLRRPTIIDNNMMGVIPDRVDAGFLYHFMQSVDLVFIVQPGALPSVNQEIVAGIEVPDFNLPEQRKIARILSTVDDLIERTEALIAKYRAIKQGLMHDLLTRGVDASGRLRPPQEEAPGLYRESVVGWAPREWEVVQFGSLIAYGPQNGIYKPEHAYGSEGTRIVRIDGFYNGVLTDQQSLRRVKLSSSDQDRYALDTNDIMINRVNSIDYVGKSAIVPALAELTVFESNIMRLKARTDRILPQFAARSLLWVNNRQQLRRRAKSAIAQASVNQQDVRALILALPELTEQEHIVAMLTAQDVALSRETQTYHKLTAVKAGLMQDLLTGRVRVGECLDHGGAK